MKALKEVTLGLAGLCLAGYIGCAHESTTASPRRPAPRITLTIPGGEIEPVMVCQMLATDSGMAMTCMTMTEAQGIMLEGGDFKEDDDFADLVRDF